VKQAVLAGDIEAQYAQPRENPRQIKDSTNNEVYFGEEDDTDPDWEYDPASDAHGLEEPASSPEPGQEDHNSLARLARKAARQLKSEAGVELSDWESETSEDEKELKELKAGLTKGKKKGKGKKKA
jgi:hypothetical protein